MKCRGNAVLIISISLLVLTVQSCSKPKPAVVFLTDFGTADGAVSAMKGVAHEAAPELELYDLTHEIPAYNVWEAAYRLYQTASFWPKGTVFVSVVDPGVGTERKSVVLKTQSGHYFVTPDNGTLTLIAEQLGIEEIREIDEAVNRRTNSNNSYTFHGRDVYAYTGARLASGVISFEEVGRKLPAKVEAIEYQRATISSDTILGNIPVLDIQYGNVWTNITDSLIKKFQLAVGDSVSVQISNDSATVFNGRMPFVNTFGDVAEGQPMAYLNSLLNFSLAINQGSFASQHHVQSGPRWRVLIYKK